MFRTIASVLVVVAGVCPSALADGDIGLRVENGAITTWEAEHSPLHFEHRERVFTGELGSQGGVITGEEPGFLVEAGSVLAGHQLGFNIRAAARVWDLLNQDFHTISPASITIERSLLGSVTTPGSHPSLPVPGLAFTLPSGGADFHYDFILNGSAAGLYLLELEKWSSAPGIAASEPFWIILNYDMTIQHEEAAFEWVQHHLVPAPGALAILGLGSLAAQRRRRRS